MRASVTPLSDITPAELASWADLYARAAEPNPYFAPHFVLAAARGLGRSDVGLLVARSGSEWVGCLPIVRARTWRRVPLPSLTTWLHDYCLLGTPLLDGGDLAESAGALVAGARRDRHATFVALEWLGADGPVGDAFAEVLTGRRDERPHVSERFERATLQRRPENDYLDGRLSSKRRKELRRQRRALERELGGEVVVHDRAGEEAAVEAFLRLEASGWKGREGTAMGTIPGHDRFFRDVCASFAVDGHLELLSMEVEGREVAMQCNLLTDDALFCFKVAYDEELSRFSTGVQLELEAIDLFHARKDLMWMDSCAAPDNELINGLWPDRRPLETLVLPAGARLRRAARPAIAAFDAARKLTRAVR
jgi:CelD/BcsL family acetyltransferase involved in cellulose biosynthesis